MPFSLETLGSLLRAHYLAICCYRCRRNHDADLSALVAAFGADYPVERVRITARCLQCGAKGPPHVDIRIGYRGYDVEPA